MDVFETVRPLGTILSVWAHPDDESWCAAGLLSAAIANKQRVVCVTATRGEAGVRDEDRWPKDQLAAIRQAELESSLRVLGVNEHHWLDYVDGTCADVDDAEAVAKLVKLIESVQPDTIVTFAPDGLTGHADHQTVSKWVLLATHQAMRKNPLQVLHVAESKEWYERSGKILDDRFKIFFNIDKPPLRPEADIDIGLQLTPILREKKLAALKAQPSQMEAMFAHDEALLKDKCSFEGFMVAEKLAASNTI